MLSTYLGLILNQLKSLKTKLLEFLVKGKHNRFCNYSDKEAFFAAIISPRIPHDLVEDVVFTAIHQQAISSLSELRTHGLFVSIGIDAEPFKYEQLCHRLNNLL